MAHRQRTHEQWRRLVGGWPDSGLTQARYCERHGISAASLHRWREIFRHQPDASRPAPSACRGREAVRLLPVELLDEVSPPDTGPALRLVFADGVRLEIAPGFDGATLRRVVGLLREGASA